MNVGSDLVKLVPGRVSTEVDARLAYDTHGIIRKVQIYFLLSLCVRYFRTLLVCYNNLIWFTTLEDPLNIH